MVKFNAKVNCTLTNLKLSYVSGMGQTVKLTALLVANQLELKAIKSFLDILPIADSSSEIFYKFDNGTKYQQFLNYGVIVFAGYTEEEMKWGIKTVVPFQKNPFNTWLRDEFQFRVEEGQDINLQFNEGVFGKVDDKVIRIAMLNLAQSVALDYYHGVSEVLLTEIKGYTTQLEQTGKLSSSRKNMLKFLGKALNTQNDIAENVYVFDTPDLTWEDEYLDKLYQALMKHFDVKVRFSEIEYTLRIIEDNVTVFRDIIHQRESNILEYIIIILILVEVFDLIISKLILLL
jgi:required for meiotic nuclear division protein 1